MKVNVLYWPLKSHNNCIENTFINANTDTMEAKEKKEAVKKKQCEHKKRKCDEKKATVPAKRVSRSKARSKPAQDDGGDSNNSISSNVAKKQQKVTVYIHIQSTAPQPLHHASTSRSKGKTEAAPAALVVIFIYEYMVVA